MKQAIINVLKHLGVAAATGAIAALTQSAASGQTNLKATGGVALAGAISGAVAYGMQSPWGQKVAAVIGSAKPV